MISDGQGMPCCKLPLALTVCPCCGAGIKFTRGWTWIDADKLFPQTRCINQSAFCPLANDSLGRIGLLWVGESFYKTPSDFTEEAARLGISRRISAVPREFRLGETWVAFAHINALWNKCPDCTTAKNLVGATFGPGVCKTCEGVGEVPQPAIFRIFKPQAIEYVTTGNETEEELDALIKRGITPVRIERVGETEDMIDPPAPNPYFDETANPNASVQQAFPKGRW